MSRGWGYDLILRWQLLGLRNTVGTLLTGDLLLVTAGAALLVSYNVASLYGSLVHIAPMIRAAWPRVAAAGIAVAVLAGAWSGRQCTRWARRLGRAPWLAVLPWPPAAQLRATRVASLAIGGILAPLPAFCGWGVSHAVAASHQGLAATTLSLCFMAGFATVALPGARAVLADETTAAHRARPLRPALVWRLVVRLDGWAPRWTGLWAQGDGGRALSRWWIGSLAVGGGAAAMTIMQGRSWPSLIIAVAGGNLAYIIGLRGAPLLSPVLRASPIGFAAAWAAVARAPLALSLVWFGMAALPALVDAPGAWRPIPAAAGVLLLLDFLFSTATAIAPHSRRRATLLYGVALWIICYQGLEYGPSYGALVAVAVLGLAALLWRRARRRFRADG